MPEESPVDVLDDDLLTTDQAASELDVTPNTLAVWRVRKTGPVYVRIRGRWVRYLRADLAAFKKQMIVRCTA